jgi:hypothetical protein
MGILYPDLCTGSGSSLDSQGLPEITNVKIKIQGLVTKTLGRRSRQDIKKPLANARDVGGIY